MTPEGRAFLNALKSLSFVESDRVPGLSDEGRAKFLADPAGFLVRASDAQAEAILAEIGLGAPGAKGERE